MTPAVDPEFQSLVPPLTPAEREGLEASLLREGCRDALVTWRGLLLDGHNRLELCQRHGVPFRTVEGEDLPDRDAARAWVIRNQFARRNLTPFQRIELALKLEEILRPAARERMLAGKADPDQNSAQGRVNEEIAEAAGLSHDTIHRARVIAEKAPEAVKAALRRGETTINAEYLRLSNPVNRLSSDSFEWYTPAVYVEAAREVMGGIDLDPASCEVANRTVRASCYYDADADGLRQEWAGRVWLNPPYCGLQGRFIEKLFQEYRAGRTLAGVALVNANSTDASWFAPLYDSMLCFVKGRIAYYSPGTDKASPTHGSVFAYLGPDRDAFARVFRQFGPILVQYEAAGVACESA